MYARMVIGEAISEEQVREFARIYAIDVLPDLQKENGFDSARLMIEDGGNMAVSLTLWKSREDCLRYHSSRSYRQFVAKTQHLLLGSFVVKLFRDHGSLNSPADPALAGCD
jgi:heme-degrading monooxygenase HmoA